MKVSAAPGSDSLTRIQVSAQGAMERNALKRFMQDNQKAGRKMAVTASSDGLSLTFYSVEDVLPVPEDRGTRWTRTFSRIFG